MILSTAATRHRARSLSQSLSVSAVAWTILVAFHGWVFARRLVDGTLFQADVLLRWAASALVVAAFVALSRAGGSLLRGRRAVALWLLVALLHAGVAAPVTPVGEALSDLPLGALGVVALPAAFSLDLLAAVALLALVAVALASPSVRTTRGALRPARVRVLAGLYPPVFRRPPPVL